MLTPQQIAEMDAVVQAPVQNTELQSEQGQGLFPGIRNVFKDVGVTRGFQRGGIEETETSEENALKMASLAEQKAKQTIDPAQRDRLLQVARQARETISGSQMGREEMFSPDVQKSALSRGASFGLESGTAYSLPSTLKALLSIIRKPSSLLNIFRPSKVIGEQTEKVASKMGAPSEDILRKYFGTPSSPNPKILERLGTEADRQILLPKLKQEVGSLFTDVEGLSKPKSYLDILTNRKGAYASGAKSFIQKFTGTTPDQRLAANLGKTYSELLHEASPAIKHLDKAYRFIQKAKSFAKIAGAGGLLTELGGKIKRGITDTLGGGGGTFGGY